jgi:predicted nucleic acid-binding protein
MSAKIFVDTNVLVYCRDATEPEKQARAAAWLAALWQERTGRLSFQVLQEYYVTVTAKLTPGLPQELARREVRLLSAWHPLAVDERLLEEAWFLQDHHHLSWWDALIVAAAQRTGCRYLLSEDFLEGYDWGNITVVNPFRTWPQDLG